MITVCSVIMGTPGCEPELFFLGQLEKLTGVTEIIFAYPLWEGFETGVYKNKKIIRKSFKYPYLPTCNYCHAFGLHTCLEMATQEYILFSDPDIFFIQDVTKVYLEQIDKYDLNIVGVAHYKPENLAQYNFPCVINCLVKREELPNKQWLNGELKIRKHCVEHLLDKTSWDGDSIDGKWLAPSPPPSYYKLFPNSGGACFDTGSNLWLWNHQKQGRFLSYWERNGSQCLYASDHFSSNFGEQHFNGTNWLMFHKTHRFTQERFYDIIQEAKWDEFNIKDLE